MYASNTRPPMRPRRSTLGDHTLFWTHAKLLLVGVLLLCFLFLHFMTPTSAALTAAFGRQAAPISGQVQQAAGPGAGLTGATQRVGAEGVGR